jgi:hypothetical protein
VIISDRLANKIANLVAPARLGLFLGSLATIWLPLGVVLILLFPKNGDTAALVLLYIFFVALIWSGANGSKRNHSPMPTMACYLNQLRRSNMSAVSCWAWLVLVCYLASRPGWVGLR